MLYIVAAFWGSSGANFFGFQAAKSRKTLKKSELI